MLTPFVVLMMSILLVGEARADSYTVRVRDVNGNPVSNVRIVGNYGFNLLSGRVTDSAGEFDFDTEDLTGASVLAFSKDAARVRFEPAEVEVGLGHCPGRVCAVIAHEDPVGTTTLAWTVRAPNGNGIAGVPVTVSSAIARCETRTTDENGVVVFAVHRTPGVCADNNNTVADNFTTITARSPTGTSYVISDPGSPKFSRCSREAISGFFVASGGPAAALPVGSAITYKVTARNPQGTPRAGVTFTGPELALLPEALRTTGVTGSFFVSTTQLGIPPQASWSLAAVSDYDVYPRQLTINPVTRTSNEVVFTAFSNFQKSGALVVDVRDGVDPLGGVAIGSPELAACDGSPVTNANGRALLGYKVLTQCNDTDADPRNDTASIMPALPGCQFTDTYQTPFERCTVENTAATFQAYCGEPAPQQYLVSGRVFDQNAEPLGGASIIRNGVLAATTGANGRYSVYVDEFTSPAFRAFSGNLIFDPQNVGLSEIDRAHENINFAAIGPLNAPGATPTPPACPAAPTYTVRGTVTALDGSPLVGATISENNVPQTTTDAQGNYSFTVSALDDVWLTVEAGGRRFDPAARYFPDVRCDRLADFHEITEESYRLVGRVVDALYRPLVGARVSLVHGGNETIAETDEDGYYLLTVPDEANYVITASYPGHELSPALYSGEGERDETGLNFTSTTQPTPTPTPIAPTPPPGSTPPPVPPTATPPGSSPPPAPPSTPTTPPGGGTPPPSNPTPPPGATTPPGSTPTPGATPPPGTPPGTPVVPTATPSASPTSPPPGAPTSTPAPSPTTVATPTPPGNRAPPAATPTPPPMLTPTRTPTGMPTSQPTNTPAQPPTVAPTATVTPTPTISVPIQLVSICSDDPLVTMRWMITNSGTIDVTLTWDIYGSAQSGSIVAPVGVTYLTTTREPGSNTLRLFRGGVMVAVQSGSFIQCPATPTPNPTETATPIPPSPPTAAPTVTPPPSGPEPTPGEPPATPTPIESPPVGPPTETPTPTVTPTPIVYSTFSGRLTGKDGASLSASLLAKLDRLGSEAIKIVAINRETAERFEVALERPYRYTLSVPAGIYRIRVVSNAITVLSRPTSPILDLIAGGPAEGASTRSVRRTRVNFAIKLK